MPGGNLVLGICFMDATVRGTRRERVPFRVYGVRLRPRRLLYGCNRSRHALGRVPFRVKRLGMPRCNLDLVVCFVDATVRKKESAFRSEIGKPILFSIFPSYFASIARAEVTSGEDATEDSAACSGVYGTLPEFPETRRSPRQSNFWCGFLT